VSGGADARTHPNFSGEWWDDVDHDWLLTLMHNWNTGQVPRDRVCISEFKDKRIFAWTPHTPIPYLHYPSFLYSIRCKRLGGDSRPDIYEGLRYNGHGSQLSTTTCPTWWVEKTFSIHFLKKLREQYEAEGNNSDKYTKCPAGEAKELSTLPSNLAPDSDAPPAIFQQGILDVCALCSLGNLLHAMKCAEGSATLMRIKENLVDCVGDDRPFIPDETWLKGFISTEDSLKKAYQPRTIKKNYKLLFPLPKQDAPKGKEAVLSKDKRKQYIPMHDRDKFGGKETPTPPLADLGTMKAVSDTEGITWEDYNTPCCEVLAMLAGANPVNVRLEDRRHCAGTPAYGRPRHKLCLPLGAITNLLEGARPSLVRLDIDGDLEPILFESLRAYTEQEQTTAQITATLEGEAMALTRGAWSATNVQPVGVDDKE
jgi:hypothetical protein